MLFRSDDAAGDVTHMVTTETSMSVEPVPEQVDGDITRVVVDHRRKKVTIEVGTRSVITGALGLAIELRTPGHHFALTWMRVPGMTGMALEPSLGVAEKALPSLSTTHT